MNLFFCTGVAVRARCPQLIVPSVVREEFARNKERILKESGRSFSGALKRARVALYTYGNPKKRKAAIEVINDIDHKLSGSGEVATEAVKRIEALFHDAIDCPVNDEALLAAAARAMENKAPFHNGRNNFADAVIIELYRADRGGWPRGLCLCHAQF